VFGAAPVDPKVAEVGTSIPVSRRPFSAIFELGPPKYRKNLRSMRCFVGDDDYPWASGPRMFPLEGQMKRHQSESRHIIKDIRFAKLAIRNGSSPDDC
jgi:hypothetical protein